MGGIHLSKNIIRVYGCEGSSLFRNTLSDIILLFSIGKSAFVILGGQTNAK